MVTLILGKMWGYYAMQASVHNVGQGVADGSTVRGTRPMGKVLGVTAPLQSFGYRILVLPFLVSHLLTSFQG